MIFLDTSGVLALADNTDVFHNKALQMFEMARETDETILLHNYVIVESAALLQRKLSSSSSMKFLKEACLFNIYWVESTLHSQAIEYMHKYGTSKLSFVDVVSFLVMRSNGITNYIGFDKHFIEAGFTQYGSSDS